MSTAETFERMKELVHRVLPNAEVYLFGSRANNTAHRESDWDILVIEKAEVTQEVKWQVKEALYNYAIDIESFINTIVVNTEAWNTHPAYYSLRRALSESKILA